MSLVDDKENRNIVGNYREGQTIGVRGSRLAKELFGGRYPPGGLLKLHEIAREYGLSEDSVSRVFAEFQDLGIVTLTGNSLATVNSPNPKEMHEAYEIRAALEEIAGRLAVRTLKGNTGSLQAELDAMRAAVRAQDLDTYAEHDVKFHRSILQASQNRILLRLWDTLAFDLRMRAAIGMISNDLPEVVESHQPIVDALEKGRGREAGLLLRNHLETFLEYLRKSESDSAFHRMFHKDLEGAKDVQQAFFPPEKLSIPGLSFETFYRPAHGIGGDYYDFLSLQSGRWGIAIGDVSGKGIGAALLMASLQASLRAQALHSHLDISTLIGDVNRLVYESSPTHFFACLFYAEYDPSTRVLKYVNAGHNPPIVARRVNGSVDLFYLMAANPPVGVSADLQFVTNTFQLKANDILVAYTDGITEAENRDGEQWGQERLENLLRSCGGSTVGQVIKCILDQVSAFADGKPQCDDTTLVVLKADSASDVCDEAVEITRGF